MKIRVDYVSNSSSSSFVMFGERKRRPPVSIDDDSSVESFKNKIAPLLTIEDFAKLEKDEAFFLVLKNAGSEGDYIFKLSPELLMDCDMHQIDLDKFIVVKAKYYMSEGGYMYNASSYRRDDGNWEFADEDEMNEDLKKHLKSDGVDLTGLRAFGFSQDYGTPKSRSDILEALEGRYEYY